MADIGAISELVNASELTLEVGADTYIMLTNLVLSVSRPESRDATTDAGALYTYGKGDHSFTATLLVTSPEITSLNTLQNIDSDGDLTSTSWKIVTTDSSSATRTLACTGVLRAYTISKDPEGKVRIDIDVRITPDTIVIT